ncbi:hypothetical protein LTR64_007097 [Lithohypha guttulata]|uniref:uncharacterized protein n=1 Tax=Lithohypha guttulata TaxID=1690604 RepID=UPI002DDF3205|nr:hypothetical protein LTR51_004347 [Lithohypha guttulata]
MSRTPYDLFDTEFDLLFLDLVRPRAMAEPFNMGSTQRIIEEATPQDIAYSTVHGLSISYRRSATEEKEKALVDQYFELFVSVDPIQRVRKMNKMFPSKQEKGSTDLDSLHDFLKEVAVIMEWEGGNDVRRLLGLREIKPLSPRERQRREEATQRDNQGLDDLNAKFVGTTARQEDSNAEPLE